MARTTYIAYTEFLFDRINYFLISISFLTHYIIEISLERGFFSGFESFRCLLEARKSFDGEPDHTLSLPGIGDCVEI